MENKADTGHSKVFENMAYGVREVEATHEYSKTNTDDEESKSWWALCCGALCLI